MGDLVVDTVGLEKVIVGVIVVVDGGVDELVIILDFVALLNFDARADVFEELVGLLEDLHDSGALGLFNLFEEGLEIACLDVVYPGLAQLLLDFAVLLLEDGLGLGEALPDVLILFAMKFEELYLMGEDCLHELLLLDPLAAGLLVADHVQLETIGELVLVAADGLVAAKVIAVEQKALEHARLEDCLLLLLDEGAYDGFAQLGVEVAGVDEEHFDF